MSSIVQKFCVLTGLLLGLPLLHALVASPRTWAVNEPRIAFWAWKAKTPTETELNRVIAQTRATTLFIRAGQFDLEQGKLRRIREVEGEIPANMEIHLVYNGTRDLLKGFENIEPAELHGLIAKTFEKDSARAFADGARVKGLQLDIDVPTRLLDRYREALQLTRAQLPGEIELSITGLPTWMDSPQIGALLSETDFWVPQFYGSVIPDQVDMLKPISSPSAARNSLQKARDLDHPFYAGLSAYGYAIVYSPEGRLIEVRGDVDPAKFAEHPNLESMSRRPFEEKFKDRPADYGMTSSEWRHLYRAKDESAIDGLVIRRGEFVMIDLPSAETLRASARAVREEAGERLLGICIFRLPLNDDPTNLTANEIADALANREAEIGADLKISRGPKQIVVNASNSGGTSALLGDGAMTIDLQLPAGTLAGITGSNGFSHFETLCRSDAALRPCTIRRANVLRLKTRAWASGAAARATISLESAPPRSIDAKLTMLANDGRVWNDKRTIIITEMDRR